MRSPYLSPEEPVCGTRRNRLDKEQLIGSKFGKCMSSLYIVTSLCLFNLYAEYFM